MNPQREHELLATRRQLFGRAAVGIGVAALSSLVNSPLLAGTSTPASRSPRGALGQPHFAPTAKNVIYLHMSGGPSHIDLFDWKPQMQKYRGQDLPDSIRMGQRITGMTSGQTTLPVAPTIFKFAQHGQCGAWVSELLPHTARIVDDICIVKSLHTEAINHDPAITFIQTGSQIPGRPSLGAWLSYGLGSENDDLPAFMAMISLASNGSNDQPLLSRLWGSGFLPSQHQGVRLRTGGDPVLYLSNPAGIDRRGRRDMLDAVAEINRIAADSVGDPEINTRIAQYEMAYRMQTSVPDLINLADEPKYILEMYGLDENGRGGQYARNCVLARRMVERGVRFIQLYHRGWDQHVGLPGQIRVQCSDTDQATAALVNDLKQRGLLDDTLVIWGGEFGRTAYCQGGLTEKDYGRDHHGRCFTSWFAGGGIKPGIIYGETDEYSYNVVRNPVHIHDMNATILHCLGIDHERLTYRFQGRDFRLTDVEGMVVRDILI
jgi:hypothetical protein